MINVDVKNNRVKEPVQWVKVVLDGIIFIAVLAVIAAILVVRSA